MASTTSTEQSGLFGYLLPEFKKASGLDVKVVALGTGQALDTARRGDADVLFVHDQVAEEKFVADGWGVKRYPVMYNDFILVGPKNDPAGVKGKDIVEGAEKAGRWQRRFCLARRQERHARRRAALLEAGRRRCRQGQRLQGMRLWHGPGAQHCGIQRRLCAGRPRHLAQLQEPRRSGRAGGGRHAPVQPVRRDGGEPRQAPACEGAGRAEIRGLGGLARRPGGDCQLQDWRRAVLPTLLFFPIQKDPAVQPLACPNPCDQWNWICQATGAGGVLLWGRHWAHQGATGPCCCARWRAPATTRRPRRQRSRESQRPAARTAWARPARSSRWKSQ
jgi:hypothetical protein